MTVAYTVDVDTLAEGTIQKVQRSENLHLPLPQVIQLIHQLKEFELGRSLLAAGGITSSWVDYVCHHEVSPTNHHLETWFLSRAPKIRAARERYFITQREIQSRLRDDMVLGVLPCGVISKIAEMDFSKVKNIKVVGYDNDIHGLVKAELKMKPLVDQEKIKLYLLKKNIWLLDDIDEHDLIISNRLSVLEPDTQKLSGLFEKFYAALKYKGFYISSFFTPSPIHDLIASPWKDVDVNDMLIEHSIFVDILDFQPASRSEDEIKLLLTNAGFKIIDILYDTHNVYPTIVAQKV